LLPIINVSAISLISSRAKTAATLKTQQAKFFDQPELADE
jgi:hypothetical protein